MRRLAGCWEVQIRMEECLPGWRPAGSANATAFRFPQYWWFGFESGWECLIH